LRFTMPPGHLRCGVEGDGVDWRGWDFDDFARFDWLVRREDGTFRFPRVR
jgi:hypothetical protein